MGLEEDARKILADSAAAVGAAQTHVNRSVHPGAKEFADFATKSGFAIQSLHRIVDQRKRVTRRGWVTYFEPIDRGWYLWTSDQGYSGPNYMPLVFISRDGHVTDGLRSDRCYEKDARRGANPVTGPDAEYVVSVDPSTRWWNQKSGMPGPYGVRPEDLAKAAAAILKGDKTILF